jgi:multidrug efflux pump subunit AcrB
VRLRPEPAGITRFDGVRCNIIRGYPRNDALPIEVARSVTTDLEESGFRLPAGYSVELGGNTENEREAVGNLTLYLPVLLILMASTLILTFRSVRLALLLGMTAILSIGLGLLATWVAGFPVSFNSILGTAGLIGVALNDSIVVLAAIRANPMAAAGERAAIVETVLGSMRHVLSTTFTTIGGFLPFLIFIGGDFWPPLAVVLAGGVSGSTLLAVTFIPAGYVLAHGDRSFLEKSFRVFKAVWHPASGSAQ